MKCFFCIALFEITKKNFIFYLDRSNFIFKFDLSFLFKRLKKLILKNIALNYQNTFASEKDWTPCIEGGHANYYTTNANKCVALILI